MYNLLPSVSFNGKFSFDFQYSEDMKHKTTLLELQKMFTYLMVCLRIVYGKLFRIYHLPKLKTLDGVHLYWLCLECLLLLGQLLVFFVIITFNSYYSTSCYLSFEESLVIWSFSCHRVTLLRVRVFWLISLCLNSHSQNYKNNPFFKIANITSLFLKLFSGSLLWTE